MLSKDEMNVSGTDTGKKVKVATPKKEKVEKEKTRQKKPRMYLGPDIQKVVRHGAVFRDELDGKLQEKIKEFPALAALIVPMAEAGKAMAEIQSGGARSVLYRAVEDEMKGGNEDGNL